MICFAWKGFPQYAARCVGAFVRATQKKVCVVATRPDVPIKGMERFASAPVKWVGEADKIDIDLPRVLFVSGWSVPVFNALARRVHASGGQVVAMVDNNFVFSFKEILKALRFRFFLRKKYDAFFVPGASGVKLLRFYGVSSNKIHTGMYAADGSLFFDGPSLNERPKRIVYVGRFNARKNVLRLADAFIKSEGGQMGWTLAMYGAGELKSYLPNHPAIEVHDFVQPEQLGDVYRNARCFALASLEEHWGLVVHEAALSGCMLLLSDRIGAAVDFVGEKNGFLFDPCSIKAIVQAMRSVFCMTETDLERAHNESLIRAKEFGLARFVCGCLSVLSEQENRA